MTARLSGVLRAVWPPVVFGVLALGLWQFVVRFFELKPYLLVAPTDTSTNAGMALMAIDIGVISWSRMLKRLSRNDISTPAMVPNTRP